MIGRVLVYDTEDLYYNLALEHAIIYLHSKNNDMTTLRFWKNPKSVVMGRNQDIDEDVDEEYCSKNEILIGRRISGGGTVYHDKGNLNISFFFPKKMITTCNNMKEMNECFTNTLIKSLEKIGMEGLRKEGIYNIFYREKKVSGGAGYFRKNWLLHHATLLISVNLEYLNKSLLARSNTSTNRHKYFPTTNLPSFDVKRWQKMLIKTAEEHFNQPLTGGYVTKEEKELAEKLRKEMYSKQGWIREKRRVLIK